MSLFAVVLFNVLPKEFAPTEDRGVVIIPTTGPEGASFPYTIEHVMRLESLLQRYLDSGEAYAVFATVGGWPPGMSGSASNRRLPLKSSRWWRACPAFAVLR